MNNEESRTDLGVVRIHKNVISSIAAVASAEVEGVKRIGGNLRSGVLEIIGKKPYSAINVEFDKAGEAKVEIPLIIKYDYNIPNVADSVQESVRNALEKMTNLTIKEININIQGIERG
jgi:uncharacterized alkaline shock family protein YloU